MLIVILLALVVLVVVIRLCVVFQEKIKFFTMGDENGFKFSEINLLWKLAKISELDEPAALFLSVPTLNKAISDLINDSRRKGIENSDKIQNFLTKLYKFRTKLNLDHENKKGLDSTKYLDKGQKLRIIFPGHGVFTSEIVNNGYEMVVKLPLQDNIAKINSNDWIDHEVSVYLWRKGDASYVFDTRVCNAGIFNGQTVIYLAQTNQLLRAQKRRSVRCECNLNASMYFIKQEVTDFNLVETEPGFKVVLEDISEDGAMIRVGGQGMVNAQLKLQFSLNGAIILMFGVVRAVEYNKEINQSRLHFECIHLEEDMKNAILSFVYNVLPQEQKDIFDALSGTEEDMAQDESAPQESGEGIVLDGKTQIPVSVPSGTEQQSDDSSVEQKSDEEEIILPEAEITTADLDKLASLEVN